MPSYPPSNVRTPKPQVHIFRCKISLKKISRFCGQKDLSLSPSADGETQVRRRTDVMRLNIQCRARTRGGTRTHLVNKPVLARYRCNVPQWNRSWGPDAASCKIGSRLLRSGDTMKRIPTFILLVACSFAWSIPTKAQIFTGPDSARQAQKAAKKQQKAQTKAAQKQQKSMKKYEKAQQKAAKRAQRHA